MSVALELGMAFKLEALSKRYARDLNIRGIRTSDTSKFHCQSSSLLILKLVC